MFSAAKASERGPTTGTGNEKRRTFPVGNLLHRHQILKFDVVGERPTENFFHISKIDEKRVEKLHRLK